MSWRQPWLLPKRTLAAYRMRMSAPGCCGLPTVSSMRHRPIEDNEGRDEADALAIAIAESDADPRTVPHDEVRAWLLRLAAGELDAPPPEPG